MDTATAAPKKQRKLKIQDISDGAAPPMGLFIDTPAGQAAVAAINAGMALEPGTVAPPSPRPSPMEAAARELLGAPLKSVSPVSFEAELDALVPSPFNPRTDFDKEKLLELRDSIIAAGCILEPIIVRPARAAGVVVEGRWEIVDGERRWRAAKLAKLKTVPVLVRELSDAAAKEAQLIANIQHESLPVLDLGRGYKELRDGHGQAVDSIAKRVGQGRSTVYDAIQLFEHLGAKGQAALNAKRVSMSAALLVSYVPKGKRQDEALAAVEGKTVAEARLIIRAQFALELKKAPFAVADAQLLPSAGPCTTCAKRTGAQASLFDEQGEKPKDYCLDAPCFDKKAKAVVERARLLHKNGKGPRVLTDEETAAAFDPYGSLRSSDFKPPDEVCYADEKGRTYKALLGKLLKEQLVLAQNPKTRELTELVAVDGLKATLDLAGLIKRRKADEAAEKPAKKASKETVASGAEVKESSPVPVGVDEYEDDKLGELVATKLGAAIADAAEKREPDKHFWRALCEHMSIEDEGALIRRGAVGSFTKYVEKADAKKLRGLFVEMLFSRELYIEKAADDGTLDELCAALKVDHQKVREAARAELEVAESKAEDEAIAAAVAKMCGVQDGKPGPKNKPCFHAKGHEGAHSNGRRTWPNKAGLLVDAHAVEAANTRQRARKAATKAEVTERQQKKQAKALKKPVPGGFVCESCNHEQSAWAGKCPECGTWGSLVEPDAHVGIPFDQIHWQPKKHPSKVAVGVAVGSGRRYAIEKHSKVSVNGKKFSGYTFRWFGPNGTSSLEDFDRLEDAQANAGHAEQKRAGLA